MSRSSLDMWEGLSKGQADALAEFYRKMRENEERREAAARQAALERQEEERVRKAARDLGSISLQDYAVLCRVIAEEDKRRS